MNRSNDLRRAFDRARGSSEQRAWVRGILGNAAGEVVVPGLAGFYYVRVSAEGRQSVTTARTMGRVRAQAGLIVRMKLENNAYVIYDQDPAYAATNTANDPTNAYGTPYHTHRLGTGLEYEVEAQLLDPGRVFPALASGAFSVYINPFRYFYGGAWQYWPGGLLDLASLQPVTSGKWAWVLVGVDPATNAAVAVAGTEQDVAVPLLVAQLDSIAFGDYIPLAALRMASADTDVSDYTRYSDARGWLGQGAAFNDAEGNPAPVVTTTALDGTSDSAARRDHVHGLTDGAVTLAKMASLFPGQFIGRYTTGLGVPEVMSFGPGFDRTTLPGTLYFGFGGDVVKDGSLGLAYIQPGVVTDVELRASNELSVIGNPTGGIAQPTDIQATTASDTVLAEDGDALVWKKIENANIADATILDAKLADVSSMTFKGRIAAGTGPITDLTLAQLISVLGGTLYTDSIGAGNVTTGEDQLSTYTIVANQTPGNGTIWFEAVGIYAANGFSKRLRLYFGTDLIFDFTSTASGGAWLIKGRVVVVGGSAERAHTAYSDSAGGGDLQYLDCTQDTTDPITFLVTGEATGTDDIDLKTLVLGWTK